MEEPTFDLEIRRTIYDFVLRNPGKHLREVSRATGIAMGTLRYHLDFLEEKGLVVSRKEKNLKCYFVGGRLTSDEKNITPLLQQKRFRDIILTMILHPDSTHAVIAGKLDIRPSTLTKYTKILAERKVIRCEKVGREKRYAVVEEDRVIELLLTFRKSFWDTFVDNVLELYFER